MKPVGPRESIDHMTPTGPDFVVAGSARAGTTALIEGLRAHPGVFVTDPKEPHYFAMHGTRPDFRGPGDQLSINRAAVTDRDDYLALYPQQSGLTLGEGSVSTLYYYEHALPELLRMNPDVRVVVLLRDPVARAYSSFQYLRSQGREPEEDFLAAVRAESERRAANWHHLWHYTAMSMYADAIGAFRELLPRDNLGIWFYDDLERDYAATLAEVLRFLELPEVPGLGERMPRVNISGTPRFRHVQQALWKASASPGLRRTARLLTSWRFREAVKSRIIRRDPLPAEITRSLAPLFEADLLRLHDFLAADVDLPAWLEPRSRARVR